MTFPDYFHKFLSDIQEMNVQALISIRGQAERNRFDTSHLPVIVRREIATRHSLQILAIDDLLFDRFVGRAPTARIDNAGAVVCETHREAVVDFLLGEI